MRFLCPLLVSLLVTICAAPVSAQGIILDRVVRPPTPRPVPSRPSPVRLKEHRVKITVEDQITTVEVEQVFFNPNPFPAEGVYLFPLPDGAAISRFTMSMGGKQVTGEILDAGKAREIYRSIVHRRRDPGLLEYAGRRLIRARLFPIPARGDTRITISFGQILKPEGGLIELVYPLRSNRFAPGPVNIAGEISVKAQAGIATLFSPTHGLDVVRKSETHWIASFEETRSAADRDLQLLYSLGSKEFGVSLVTQKPAGEDGYFLMLVAPNTNLGPSDVLPKDIVFVIDTSGSMGDRGGKKMKQAKAALAYAIGRLDPRDRFNVIAFSTEARSFRERTIPAAPGNVEAALAYVKGLEATGGTAIHEALLAALRLERTPGRVPIVIFLTDGQATIGPTDNRTILDAVEKANRAGARLFIFGVGDNLNAALLTELADRNSGSGNFVSERENIEVKVSALYDKVASPVLTDVSLSIQDVGDYDVYPRAIGDLFRGQQLVVVGRYRKGGPRAIRLKGRIGAREVQFVYEAEFKARADREFLPRLWAVRKVGFLLGEIRRNGARKELVDEISRLGIRHGIVTPYTSFLVVEEEELRRRRARPAYGFGDAGGGAPAERAAEPDREVSRRKEMLDEAREALEAKSPSGRGAVAGARIAGKLRKAESARETTGIGVKTIGGKSFRLRDGVWIDSTLEEFLATHPDAPRKQVDYLSPEYDVLAESDAIARYLSAGAAVRFVHEGTVYEVRSAE